MHHKENHTTAYTDTVITHFEKRGREREGLLQEIKREGGGVYGVAEDQYGFHSTICRESTHSERSV